MKKYAFLALAGLLSNSAMALQPPWYYAMSVLKGTVGASTCISVSEPVERHGHYEIDVKACSDNAANGLRQLLKPQFSATQINVLTPSGQIVPPPRQNTRLSQQQVVQVIQNGMEANTYFVTAHASAMPPAVALEFKKSVIQVWVDNAGDFWGNNNYVAQDAFTEVMVTSVGQNGLAFTTSRE